MVRSVEEILARTMCEMEHWMRHPTLDGYFEEVGRTWKRHIPEARRLIECLETKGLRIVEKAP